MTDADRSASLDLIVADLRTEGDELHALMATMDTGFWTQTSSFKDWTVWDVIAHLHLSDHMALTTLRSGDDFKALLRDMAAAESMRDYTQSWLSPDGQPLTGPDLLERWRALFLALCDTLKNADPDQRFLWAGPGMKARMFATARQMETWAHGWEIYDLLGIQRKHTDRIKNIATIGYRTFGWTFQNRRLAVPEIGPYLNLTAPSGALWTFGDNNSPHRVEGSAVEFCQVVTQVRHVDDTQLSVRGENAINWMAIAQCFAGPPETPPEPGSRSG